MAKNKANKTAKTNEANKAIEADKAKASEAEDANKAVVTSKAKAKEAIVADEAVVANKANNANIAKANEVANKEANKTNDADEANVAIEANESKANKVVTADEVVAVNVAKAAIETNESPLDGNVVDVIYANKANAATVADKVDLTIVANKVKEVDKASVSIKLQMLLLFLSICKSLFDNGVAIVLYLPFSLTKYSAIFTQVKGDFEIFINQLGHLKRGCLSPYSLMIQFVCISESVFKNIWSKCSLRSQCNNQLEQVVVNGGWSAPVEKASTIN